VQTSFTEAQLADPATAESAKILRRCVHCGFCTATCPTFLLLGDELDSPRGRIYLIKDMLENDRPATAEVVTHIDRCLSCLSCMTTCPSGVNYMHLIDHAREHVEATYRRPLHDRLLRRLLAFLLPRVGLFRIAVRFASPLRPLARLIPGAGQVPRRLRAMLSLAPASLPARSVLDRPGVFPAEGPRRHRVILLLGCAQRALAPSINDATIRLLNRMGVEVVVPKGAGCCGALTHHMGQADAAHRAAIANVAAWTEEIERGGADAILVNTSGCGTTVKDYGFLLRGNATWADKAARVAGLTRDVTEFLANIGYEPTREPTGLKVAYHSACSMQHGQKITKEPRALLSRAGFELAEIAEGHICCGSAGTYNLLQPEIAGQLRERKLGNIRATGADLVAAGNIGCITQLAGDRTPVLHTIELLDWMAGGPEPAAIATLASKGRAG